MARKKRGKKSAKRVISGGKEGAEKWGFGPFGQATRIQTKAILVFLGTQLRTEVVEKKPTPQIICLIISKVS